MFVLQSMYACIDLHTLSAAVVPRSVTYQPFTAESWILTVGRLYDADNHTEQS